MAKKEKGFNIIINHIKTHGSITKKQSQELYGLKNFEQYIAYIKKVGYDVTYRKNKLGQREYFFKDKKEESIKKIVNIFEKWDKQANEVLNKEKTEEKEITVEAEDMVVKTTMKQVILDHLKKHKTITSAIAMRKYKCLNLSAVIQKLKKDGWNISRTETRKNNDYNVVSNRNNAYSIYTLEKKVKTKSIYTIHCLHERCMNKLIPVVDETFETFDEARNYCCNLAENLISDCNTLFGTNLTKFKLILLPEAIQVVKTETIKKLFRKKEKNTMLASFCVLPRLIEVL